MLSKILTDIEKEYEIKNIIEEGKYSRLRQHMAGLTNVKTITIVTSENPNPLFFTKEQLAKGDRENPKLNRERIEKLEKILKNGEYSYSKLDKKGSMYKLESEDSFVIYNINRLMAINFAKAYGQESVIWGKNLDIPDSKNKFTFEYIEDKSKQRYQFDKNRDYETVSLTDRVITLEKDTEDNYSKLKGRKFIIPFFDDEYAISESYTQSILDIKPIKPYSYLNFNSVQKVEEEIINRKEKIESEHISGSPYYYSRKALQQALGFLKYLEE